MINSDQDLNNLLTSIDKTQFKVSPFVKKIEKPWGYELLLVSENLPYVSKIMHINAGKRLSLQIHDQKLETYYLATGQCDLVIENNKGELETIHMVTGYGYTVIPGQRHRHQAVTDCDIVEASSPEAGTTYRLEDDYARSDETEEMRKGPNRGWSY